MMNKHEVLMDSFETCAKEHLNNSDIRGRIYKKNVSLTEFSNALEEVIQPVYQSAKNCGFRKWIYRGEIDA